MKIVLKYITVLILFFIFSNCQEELYIAQDYVYVGDFTESLEGPAVDQKGNLYFVNPDHVGSIGVVDQQGNFSIFIDQLPEGEYGKWYSHKSKRGISYGRLYRT